MSAGLPWMCSLASKLRGVRALPATTASLLAKLQSWGFGAGLRFGSIRVSTDVLRPFATQVSERDATMRRAGSLACLAWIRASSQTLNLKPLKFRRLGGHDPGFIIQWD